MRELVTVIITTHEREAPILKRAIDSVLKQTYHNIEIIIVNDAPNYPGRAVIEKMLGEYPQGTLQYYINDTFPGASGSRNIGIQKAKGIYIALLDDDDAFDEKKLENTISQFDGNIGLVYSDYDQILNGEVIERKKLPCYEGDVFEHLLHYNFIGGCSIPVMKAEVFEKAGLFDNNMPSSQDEDMWLRISKYFSVKYVDLVLTHYYVSDVAITTNPDRRINGWKKILEKYKESFDQNIDAKAVWQNLIVEMLLQHSRYHEAVSYYNEVYYGKGKLKNIKHIIRGIIKGILYSSGKRKR